MLRHWEAAESVIGWMEAYEMMRNAFNPLQETRLVKFHQLFSEERQRFIGEALFQEGQVGQLLDGP